METDRAFEELRAETGSPLPVRVPFGLFGITINLSLLVWGWDGWPVVMFVVIGILAAPAWLSAIGIQLRFIRRKGMFYDMKRPVLYQRWSWWLLIWPAQDEPAWRKSFAVVVLAAAVTFFTTGVIRWGLFPTPFG